MYDIHTTSCRNTKIVSKRTSIGQQVNSKEQFFIVCLTITQFTLDWTEQIYSVIKTHLQDKNTLYKVYNKQKTKYNCSVTAVIIQHLKFNRYPKVIESVNSLEPRTSQNCFTPFTFYRHYYEHFDFELYGYSFRYSTCLMTNVWQLKF